MSLSREKINHLSQLIVQDLTARQDVTLEAPTNTVRLEIVRAIQEALKLEEDIDAIVRRILTSYSRQIVEGSREWDVMHQKLYDEEFAKR
jgi:hypothetical protein